MCAPPEAEEMEGEGGTDFEAAEGGGFDEGQGMKNVSKEVDAENLVRILVLYVTHTFIF